MSVLLKHFKPKQIFYAYRVLIAAPTRQGHFFPDYLPGPIPKTKEERELAAKKYNLLPEEYEPYPDSENPVGDYPKLPFESVDSKNPYHPWDMQEIRKDFNEPVPREIMMLLPEAISTGEEEYSPAQKCFVYFSLCAVSFLIIYTISLWEFVQPVCEKQYPTPGVTHYSFDHLSNEEWEKLKAEIRVKECIEKCKTAQE